MSTPARLRGTSPAKPLSRSRSYRGSKPVAIAVAPQLATVAPYAAHLVSTLRKYVRALGGDICVIAELGAERIVLLDI